MISLLKGEIAEIRKHHLVLMTPGGVGYEVMVSPVFLASCVREHEMTLHTYLKVGQDAMSLYGFANEVERDFFTLLMTVSGVGPKTAMNVLSAGAVDKIQSAIARGDVTYLTDVCGLGKKTVDRLVVELKGKVHADGSVGEDVSDVMVEVIDVLVDMGYAKEQAKITVQSLDAKDKNTEQLLREALKKIK